MTMPILASFGRWLNLKQYQFEVTFSVYMFTSLEKFVVCKSPRSPHLL